PGPRPADRLRRLRLQCGLRPDEAGLNPSPAPLQSLRGCSPPAERPCFPAEILRPTFKETRSAALEALDATFGLEAIPAAAGVAGDLSGAGGAAEPSGQGG